MKNVCFPRHKQNKVITQKILIVFATDESDNLKVTWAWKLQEREVTFPFFAHHLSNDLQVAKLWIERQSLPQVFISASIRQILMTGEMQGLQRWWLRCQSDAAACACDFFLLFFLNLGLEFNCVFAVSAVQCQMEQMSESLSDILVSWKYTNP